MGNSNAAAGPMSRGGEYDLLDQRVRGFERIFAFLVPLLAVLLALLAVAILIVAQGANPIEAYRALFQSAFGSAYSIGTSLNIATPLILSGLGIAMAARAGIINLGAEGQIMFGGIFATVVANGLPGLPGAILLPLCILAGFAGGALWALIPAYFYAKRGVNIMITTIMMNDIADGILSALIKGPLRAAGSVSQQSATVPGSAQLSLIWPDTRLHAGFLLALALAALCYVLLFRSPVGYRLRMLGENPTAALHSGLQVDRMKLLAVLVAGGLAGLAGATEILGAQYKLRMDFLANYGYESLAVAMLAQKNPLGVMISGILFGALKAGRSGMSRTVNLPTSFSMVLSGVIIFFVAVSPFMMKLPRTLAMRDLRRRQGRSAAKGARG